MKEYAGLVQQALFFGSAIVVLTVLTTAVWYPMLHSRLRVLNAQTRASILLALCCLPIVATSIVLIAALLPSLLQLFGIENDHCLGHTEEHRHFCLIHRPSLLDSQPLDLLALAFLSLIVLLGARLVVDVVRTRRFRNMLKGYRVISAEGVVRVLDTALPLAFSSGIVRPRIFLSTGLLQSLSAEERELLIAHEQAHLARHDSLRLLLARALSLTHLPWVRKSVLAELQLASEQACDEAAARQADAPCKMAELLLKIEGLYQRHFPQAPLVLNLLGDNRSMLPARIEALLSPAAGQLPRAVLFTLVLAGVLAISAHDLLHDWLEHALHLFQE